MNSGKALARVLTHPLTVVVAAMLVAFFSLINASNHTIVGWLLSGHVKVHTDDHVGPRRIVTYDVVIIDGQTHIVTDSGPYQGDSLAKALQLINEEVGPQTPLEFYEVRFARWFSRRTGLIVPMTTREKFFVWTTVFDPKTYDHVPASARRAAVDAFVAAWPGTPTMPRSSWRRTRSSSSGSRGIRLREN